VRTNLHELVARSGTITVEEFHILRHVSMGQDCASDLAKAKHISRSAVSQAVEGLVQKGLLTRQTESGDRRFIRLALSPAGSQLLESIFSKNRVWLAERFAALNPAEADTLASALETLARVLTQ
jgi:DNA-binding MarR family transcriptional regulator